MYIIKWSNGDSYLQSLKKDKDIYIKQQHYHEKGTVEKGTVEKGTVEKGTVNKITTEDQHGISRNYVFKDSYKEEVSHRVGEREHIQQSCINPFISNNFVKDLAVQEEYLKPKNSNYSK